MKLTGLGARSRSFLLSQRDSLVYAYILTLLSISANSSSKSFRDIVVSQPHLIVSDIYNPLTHQILHRQTLLGSLRYR